MHRAEETAVSVEVYTAVVLDCRAVDTVPSPRDVLEETALCILFVFVPDLATTCLVVPITLVLFALRAAVVAVVALRAVLAEVGVLADTFLAFDVTPDADVVAVLRAVVVVFVALLALFVFEVVALRETTFRVAVLFVFFVLASTFICAFDWEGVVPGFRFVRIVLFI